MINQAQIGHFSVPMLPALSLWQRSSYPLYIINIIYIVVDGCHVHLFRAMSHAILAYSIRFCHIHCVVFFNMPSIVIENEIISLYPNGKHCDSSTLKQNSRELLNEVGIFFPEISCCQSRGFLVPFAWASSHGIDNTNKEISCSTSHLQSQNLCAMVFGIFVAHISFIININSQFGSPQVDHNCFMPN